MIDAPILKSIFEYWYMHHHNKKRIIKDIFNEKNLEMGDSEDLCHCKKSGNKSFILIKIEI